MIVNNIISRLGSILNYKNSSYRSRVVKMKNQKKIPCEKLLKSLYQCFTIYPTETQNTQPFFTPVF